jgi:uncharacterized membrane protein YoaK (UPF0700 family)
MRSPLVNLLSLNAGYVDTAGFLALNGLFTSHVTGNFVTLAASLVSGGSGALAKTLALPTFCLVIVLTRLLSHRLGSRARPALRNALLLQCALLAAGAVLALHFGPFQDSDRLPAIATGLTLVAAMAIQNAAHRVHLHKSPPGTVMTGTTTQIMLDLADVFGRPAAGSTAAVRERLRRLSEIGLMFTVGCASAAFLYAEFGGWCFVVPPLLTLTTALLPETAAVGA